MAAWCAGLYTLKYAQNMVVRSVGGMEAALLPLPGNLALTAAARLGAEMQGTAVFFVGAYML